LFGAPRRVCFNWPMPTAFRRVVLIGKSPSSEVSDSIVALAGFVRGEGCEVLAEADSAQADLAVVIGGDGTMLAAARNLVRHKVPVVGINQGRLGFMTDIALKDMRASIGAILAGRYSTEERTLIDAEIVRDGKTLLATLALNDAVVNKGAQGRLTEFEVYVDGEFVYRLRSDGVIVATPTGSTAYALSAQGPIVDPGVPAILLVPVAPHALSNRPIAVRDSAVVTITLLRGKDASLHSDGQAHYALAEGDRVVVGIAAHRARLLHPKDHDHFAMLRRKLHWAETPDQLRPARAGTET
jgi:NAD+ kinase